MVLNGRIPTPELLLSIAKSFLLYFEADGDLSLEQVFFGTPKRKSGIYANRALRENRYLVFHDTVLRTRGLYSAAGKEQPSIESLAETFIESDHLFFCDEEDEIEETLPEIDIDSFLRGYRRWKKNREPLADE